MYLKPKKKKVNKIVLKGLYSFIFKV